MKRMIEMLTNDGYAVIPNKECTNKLYTEAVTMQGHNITLILIPMHGKITAQIFKPNGTHRWYYEKSEAQIMSALRQTRSFYEWK